MLQSNLIRKSGIEPIGDITWGTHISHIYSSKNEFAEVLAPYIKEGLLSNELCIWIYSPNISRQEIIDIIRRLEERIEIFISTGQFIIIPYTEWYVKDGHFNGARVTNQWLDLIKYAQKNEYEGLRAVGDTFWLNNYSEEFSNYESSVSSIIHNLPFTVICTYDINNVDINEFEDIINNHSLNILKAKNELQIIKNNETDKKKAELRLLKKDIELKQKEKILLDILDSSTEGTFIVDFKKETMLYSEQWAKRLGLGSVPSDQLIQSVHLKMLPEDLIARQKSLQNYAMDNLSRFTSEFRIRDNNNDIIWVLEQGKLIYDDKGELSKEYGSFMDITDRKRHESQIKRKNTILRAINNIYEKAISCETIEELGRTCLNIVETVTASQFSFIGEIGKDGLLHDIAISDPGWELCEMHGTTVGRRLPYNFKIHGLYGSVLKKGKSLLTNTPSMHPDSIGIPKGHPRITSFLGVPFFRDNKVMGMIAAANREGGFREEDEETLEALTPTVFEVLLKKRMEAALHQSEKHAHKLVEELKKADSNKNIFLSSLSHELRNPLATISAGLSILELSKDQMQIKKAQEIIQRQIDQLCHLVDDLLDLTRITHNKIELNKERIKLNDLALLILEDHKRAFEQKGIKLQTDIKCSFISVEADPVRLRQIIGNLLHNSLKFTDEGGETLLAIYEDKNEAVISVKDTGIGINPELLPVIFEPFIQADNSLDRRNGGLGLGLSIVKGIAELHGGSASVQSDGFGKGTVFNIRLPVCNRIAEETVEPDLKERKTKRVLRILLIEDNHDFSDLLCSMFVVMGHEAVSVNDGLRGLEQAKSYKPDIIFCDIGLPGMNGFEVAKGIRKDALLNDLFMVALTGYAGPKDIELAMEAGFNRHLAKPVDLISIECILDEVP